MTNVRNLELPQWRRLSEKPSNRCLIPLTEFCEWTPEKHDLGDDRPALKGEMWFRVVDRPVFAVAGFWQHTKSGPGFTMVTCDANALVAPRWMNGRASGATSAKACTCAMTSCRKRRSYSATAAKSSAAAVPFCTT